MPWARRNEGHATAPGIPNRHDSSSESCATRVHLKIANYGALVAVALMAKIRSERDNNHVLSLFVKMGTLKLGIAISVFGAGAEALGFRRLTTLVKSAIAPTVRTMGEPGLHSRLVRLSYTDSFSCARLFALPRLPVMMPLPRTFSLFRMVSAAENRATG
jgi:hypothetical protein